MGTTVTHKSKTLKSFVVLVAMASVVALAGCTSSPTSAPAGPTNQTSHLQQVIKRGTLNVGVLPDYPPYSSQQANGDLIGYEPDIAKKLADALGVKLKMVNLSLIHI